MLSMQFRNYMSHSGACFATFIFSVETHDETPCSNSSWADRNCILGPRVVHLACVVFPILDKMYSDLDYIYNAKSNLGT